MNPNPFASLNHFTVPAATLCSLHTGAIAPTSRPSRFGGPDHLGRASGRIRPDTKRAAGYLPCGRSLRTVAVRPSGTTTRRSIAQPVSKVKPLRQFLGRLFLSLERGPFRQILLLDLPGLALLALPGSLLQALLLLLPLQNGRPADSTHSPASPPRWPRRRKWGRHPRGCAHRRCGGARSPAHAPGSVARPASASR